MAVLCDVFISIIHESPRCIMFQTLSYHITGITRITLITDCPTHNRVVEPATEHSNKSPSILLLAS